MSRILVMVEVEESGVIIRTMDNEVLYDLNLNENFKIDNQIRVWNLDSIKPNKFGKRVAYFSKYGNKGNIIDSFHLIDGEKYLFATSSGSARNGVAHKYREAKDVLEKYVEDHQWSKNIIKYIEPDTDVPIELGTKWFGSRSRFDRNIKSDGSALLVKDRDSDNYFDDYNLSNFNYGVIYNHDRSRQYLDRKYIDTIYLKKGFNDLEFIIEVLKDILDEEKEITVENLGKKYGYELSLLEEIVNAIPEEVKNSRNTDNIKFVNQEEIQWAIDNPWLYGEKIISKRFWMFIERRYSLLERIYIYNVIK